ncbi:MULTISPECIES: SLAP domain-containing protein [unclassified Lactobacillus]|uniref:SLAP domain-containing protein n=1 Tax=unclassified Lactobacillus TaxID=2620435 RepID=UPI00226A7294|nr:MULTISPECIES: SLAP domain-containing protein [unclassified Lactobacillus]MCX8720303.1 DUF1542 domain-containing protein [Lactobacillus sp. B4010]MCX8732878.1 DUF1542 domain-containing protein [Lactobacillus sp. B4015]MCX8735069.1 DUF1542 domain-containing protein [Lactobacillus sp. B4012]
MNKNNSYKKVIVSLSGAALLTVGLGQMPNNVLNNMPVEVSAAKKTKVIGANSAIYRLKGKKMVKTGTVLKVGKKVSVSSKKTVKGKVYYKIGKNQYIKAVNVDGRNRKAAKKAVLYTRKGKVIKSSKISKGQKVTIYGAAVTIKGKKYYSTKLGYIKASALAKREPAIDDNDVEKPNENNTTPNNKPDSGNNTASANNSNSTSVPSTGGSNSTSPSIPTVDPALQPAKNSATGKIKAAAKEAQDKISGNKNLSKAQQKTAIDAIDKAVTDAIGQDEKSGAVNAATTTDGVTKAENAATDAIDKAVKDATALADKNLQGAKDQAVGKIKDAATEAKNKIADNKNLTDKQQKAVTDKITELLDKATDEKTGAVDAAKTTDDVTTAEKDATDAINNAVNKANDEATKNLQDAKDTAVKDIKEAQDDAVNLVKSSPLTDAEKETAINQIEDIVKAALGEQKDGKSGSINDAKTLADVKNTKDEATAKCELAGNKLVSNDLAKQEGNFVKDAVAKMDDGDAKTAAPDKIAKAVTAAKDAIAKAKTQADLDKAEADFQNALNDAVPFAKQQEYAIDTINNAVKTAKDEINNDDWMSEDEKNATLSEIDTVVKLALGEKQDGTSGDVHDAKTTSDIFTAVNTVLATCRVKQTSDSLKKQQEAAIKEINQAADDAIQAVKDTPASTENKQAAIDRINAIVKNALGEQKDGSTGDIHDAKSGSEVSVIKNKAIKACKLEEDKLTSSELVSQVSDFASESATKMDDGDAKTAAPDKITKAAKTAKDAIASAKSQADLDKAETDFQNALNDAVPFAKQQEYAVDTIKKAAEDAKTVINNNANLSKDEKDAALSKIDTVVKVALGEKQDGTSGDVHEAKTTSDIFTAVNMVLATCEAGKTDSSLKEQKDSAIKEINQAADDAIHTVTGSPASTENKQAAVDRINAIVKDALGKQKDGSAGSIHDAMSEDEINTIKDQVTKECELEGKKLSSSELVSQVSDFVSKSIANMDDGDAKTAAPDKIAKAVKDAKDAIASARSQAELDKAETDFQSALNDAVPFAKQQAYTVDSINNAVKAAKDKIKNDGLLTDSDKEEKLAQIDAVVKAALGNQKDGTNGDVHDATTTNDLLLAQNSVITVCNQI